MFGICDFAPNQSLATLIRLHYTFGNIVAQLFCKKIHKMSLWTKKTTCIKISIPSKVEKYAKIMCRWSISVSIKLVKFIILLKMKQISQRTKTICSASHSREGLCLFLSHFANTLRFIIFTITITNERIMPNPTLRKWDALSRLFYLWENTKANSLAVGHNVRNSSNIDLDRNHRCAQDKLFYTYIRWGFTIPLTLWGLCYSFLRSCGEKVIFLRSCGKKPWT